MKKRLIRVSIIVALLVIIGTLSLSFKNIDIEGRFLPTFKRGSDNVLGIKLGLDLEGGAHLVYKADYGSTIAIVTNTPISPDILAAVVEQDKIQITQIISNNENTEFSIKTPNLTLEQKNLINDLKESQLGEQYGVESLEIRDVAKPTSSQMIGAVDTIQRRVNLYGTDEPIIQQYGDDRILVQLPGIGGSRTTVVFESGEEIEIAKISNLLEELFILSDPSVEQDNDAFNTFIIKSASLTKEMVAGLEIALTDRFGTVSDLDSVGGIEDAKKLIGKTALLEFKERTCTDQTCFDYTDTDIGLSGDDLSEAYAASNSQTGEWSVNIRFNDQGSKIFSDLTQRIVGNTGKRISIILDGEELIAPIARAWIRDGRSEITGNFSRLEAQTVSIQLDSGRLPIPLNLIQESSVDALLGAESLQKSLIAGLVGLSLVLLFMIIYYRIGGVVAALALIFYTIILLAIFKLIPITLTLPHIGGLILSIGLAVDSNILIFERMKEEIRLGRSVTSAIEVGFNRAWPAIRDGNVSTFITCGVLLFFGNRLGGGLINGFALSLLIGVAVSMFTAVIVSHNLLQILANLGLSSKPFLFTPEKIKKTEK
ncbi:MAG TPA: protein translocase subunit SecD [Dehalococcoidia bacterium]|jgi:preprotein translocase subunit SecD|nr:protein translocase subunit SecD [Dehalococcoidia bacterium]|tara:strand:+ start:3324 stop:5114 length:1791 start_codon:yes stop_codon:yes gene_type:complete